jgi:hypothetical protein
MDNILLILVRYNNILNLLSILIWDFFIVISNKNNLILFLITIGNLGINRNNLCNRILNILLLMNYKILVDLIILPYFSNISHE